MRSRTTGCYGGVGNERCGPVRVAGWLNNREDAGSNAEFTHCEDGRSGCNAESGGCDCRGGDVCVDAAVFGAEPLLQCAGGFVASGGANANGQSYSLVIHNGLTGSYSFEVD